MCQFKSMIVTKGDVLYSINHDDHARLIRENGLNDTRTPPDFVKIELVPQNGEYENLEAYKFVIDQDTLPDWWEPVGAEAACREVLKKIMVFPLVHFPGNLSVYSSATLKADALKSVGGDLYVHSSTSLPALESVGGYLCVYSSATLKADALKSVGGDLHVHSSATLPALKSVGGNLCVYSSATLKADALKSVGGDLYVDSSATLKADALKSVGGDLHVHSSTSLPALESVGGYLCVYSSATLPALKSVGGYLYVYSSATLKADALKSVGGKSWPPEKP